MISSSLKYSVRAIYIVSLSLLAGCRERDQSLPIVPELQTVYFRIILPDLRDKKTNASFSSLNITSIRLSISKVEKPTKHGDYVLSKKIIITQNDPTNTVKVKLLPGNYYITKLVVFSGSNPIFSHPTKTIPR